MTAPLTLIAAHGNRQCAKIAVEKGGPTAKAEIAAQIDLMTAAAPQTVADVEVAPR